MATLGRGVEELEKWACWPVTLVSVYNQKFVLPILAGDKLVKMDQCWTPELPCSPPFQVAWGPSAHGVCLYSLGIFTKRPTTTVWLATDSLLLIGKLHML